MASWFEVVLKRVSALRVSDKQNSRYLSFWFSRLVANAKLQVIAETGI